MKRSRPGIPMTWIKRSFHFDHPAGTFPAVVDRFRGAVPRMGNVLLNTSEELLRYKPDGRWCILQHSGHLLALESLGETRLEDFLEGNAVLTPADMNNRLTEEGGYEMADPSLLLKRFHQARHGLADRLSTLTPDEITRPALHTRLKMELRLIDWLCFMCEHDDHHLAVMNAVREAGEKPGGVIL